MTRPPVGGVVAAHDELAVRIWLGLTDFDQVVLVVRQDCIVELHCACATPQKTLGDNRPGVGMAENSAIFLDAFVNARHVADVIVRFAVGGPEQMIAVFGIEMFVDGIHRAQSAFARRNLANHGPGHVFEENLAFLVLLRADFETFFGETAQIPLAIPQFAVAGFLDGFRHLGIFLHIGSLAQVAGNFKEGVNRPDVQEGDQRAFAAAQVQAVVPIGAQTLADAGRTDLFGRKVEGAFHVLVNGGGVALGKGDNFIEKTQLAGFFDVFHDGRHQPEMVIGAGVLQPVDQFIHTGRGHHGRQLHTGKFVLLGFKDRRVKQVQPITGSHLPPEQFPNPLAALGRVGVDDRQDILRSIAIAQPRRLR